MAERRIITCDMCGRELKEGCILTHSNRRKVRMSWPQREAFRFDLCGKCFERIKAECRKAKEGENHDE